MSPDMMIVIFVGVLLLLAVLAVLREQNPPLHQNLQLIHIHLHRRLLLKVSFQEESASTPHTVVQGRLNILKMVILVNSRGS